VVSFTSRPLNRQGKSPWYPLDRGIGWGPRAGLDAVVKRKIPSPCRVSNPQIIQPVAQRYTTELSRLFSEKKLEAEINFDTYHCNITSTLHETETDIHRLLSKRLNIRKKSVHEVKYKTH
jgi:hypothetical protein